MATGHDVRRSGIMSEQPAKPAWSRRGFLASSVADLTAGVLAEAGVEFAPIAAALMKNA